MEFKRCERCGCFFVSNNNICGKCMPKDENEITRLKTYFEGDNIGASLDEISNNTGITVKNLNRYINTEEFKGISESLQKNGSGEGFNNISTNL